jgi:hypothetical protein
VPNTLGTWNVGGYHYAQQAITAVRPDSSFDSTTGRLPRKPSNSNSRWNNFSVRGIVVAVKLFANACVLAKKKLPNWNAKNIDPMVEHIPSSE